jgi:hypothetical protein
MNRAEATWPRGRLHPQEAARLRTRRALARVVGTVDEGPGWSVHSLPLERAEPSALPRSLLLVHAPDVTQAAAHAARWGRALSTVGTDQADSAGTWLEAGATRVDPTGRMQRPDLDRIHDGVRWVLQAARPVG